MYTTELPDNKHPYNDPEKIENFIKHLKELDLNKISFPNLSNIITKVIGSIPAVEITFQAGRYVARARKKSNSTPFDKLSEITMRGSEFVTSYGRANKPNQATFYCSTNDEIAIKETTHWHINDLGILINRKMLKDYHLHSNFLTVSIWRVKEDLKLASLFMNKEAMEANHIVRYFGESVMNEKPESLDANTLKSMNLLLEFFSDEFAKKVIKTESEYYISAYYASQIFEASNYINRVDGVVYPTVALDYKGENLALTESTYNNKLEFVTAYHVIAFNQKFEDGSMPIGTLHQVIDVKGDNLIWEEIKGTPVEDF